jgi:excisionase family DNA binding protein
MASEASPRDRVLTVDQAAALLGVSRRWLVREGVRKNKVPVHRPPGSRLMLFLESDLWRTLESWRDNEHIGTPPKDKKAVAKKAVKR